MPNPNPGSKEAEEAGCSCPVYSNNFGEGFEESGEVCYVVSEGCPLHSIFIDQEDYDKANN